MLNPARLGLRFLVSFQPAQELADRLDHLRLFDLRLVEAEIDAERQTLVPQLKHEVSRASSLLRLGLSGLFPHLFPRQFARAVATHQLFHRMRVAKARDLNK